MANRLKMALIDAILSLKARGWSNRRIALELDVDRHTVSRQRALKCRQSAHRHQRERRPRQMPPKRPSAGLAAATRSACEPWRDRILAKLDQGLTAQRIYQDLVNDQEPSGRVGPGITPRASRRSGRAQLRHPVRPVMGSPAALLSVEVALTRVWGTRSPAGVPSTGP